MGNANSLAIVSKTPLDIPAGPDSVAFSLLVSPTLRSSGVSATLGMSFQHYRPNADGTAPLRIGEGISVPPQDVARSQDADFLALWSAVQAAVAAYITAKGI